VIIADDVGVDLELSVGLLTPATWLPIPHCTRQKQSGSNENAPRPPPRWQRLLQLQSRNACISFIRAACVFSPAAVSRNERPFYDRSLADTSISTRTSPW